MFACHLTDCFYGAATLGTAVHARVVELCRALYMLSAYLHLVTVQHTMLDDALEVFRAQKTDSGLVGRQEMVAGKSKFLMSMYRVAHKRWSRRH